MDVVSYALSKRYTDDTVIGLGFLKGANCTIQSAIHEDGKTVITFEWKATDDTTRTTTIEVLDGTPIYTWTSGESYNVGDIAIYNSAFYICTTANSDVTFNPNKWSAVGSADSSFGIVDTASHLPSIYTVADTKLYYVIDEAAFYLWTGTTWELRERAITEAEIDSIFA